MNFQKLKKKKRVNVFKLLETRKIYKWIIRNTANIKQSGN